MIKSMTGYARVTKELPQGSFVVEIHSVNRRSLELNLFLPKGMLACDLKIRQKIAESVSRGQITVRVGTDPMAAHEPSDRLLVSNLKNLKEHWEKVALKLGFDAKKEISLSFLLNQLPLTEQRGISDEILLEIVGEAIDGLLKMKVVEGRALEVELAKRIKILEKYRKQIVTSAPKSAKKYLTRLKEKVKEISTPDLEDRLYREMVLFADKIDITEELVRLESHFKQFLNYLKSKEKTIGKTLEFLSQEILREINTISSKAQESEILAITIEMKSEIEKIREQVQNIE